jgi:hypothetical protein
MIQSIKRNDEKLYVHFPRIYVNDALITHSITRNGVHDANYIHKQDIKRIILKT